MTYKLDRRSEIILKLALLWFVWNQIAIALISAKSPNFSYQSFLLVLFFSIYAYVAAAEKKYNFDDIKKIVEARPRLKLSVTLATLIIAITLANVTVTNYQNLSHKLQKTRQQEYSYTTTGEKFYEFAEFAQRNGATTKDILITQGHGDYWFRYYIIFLTGSEAVEIPRFREYNPSPDELQRKYNRLHLVHYNDDTPLLNITGGTQIQATETFKMVSFNLQEMDLKQIEGLYR